MEDMYVKPGSLTVLIAKSLTFVNILAKNRMLKNSSTNIFLLHEYFPNLYKIKILW